MNSGTGAGAEGQEAGADGRPRGADGQEAGADGGQERADDLAAVAVLHAVLAGAGLDLTATEVADALWLALHTPGPDRPAPQDAEPAPGGGAPRPARPADGVPRAPANPEPREPAPPNVEPPPEEPMPAPGPLSGPAEPAPPTRHPVLALTGPRPGTTASAVRVPGVAGLPHALAVARGLRPLKRRVASLHRFELDEAATAQASADSHGLQVVLRPQRARWLDLVLAVDESMTMRVWHDTVAELDRLLSTSGIFRRVRRVPFDRWDAMEAAVPDGSRTVVLVVTDGVGPAWQRGSARHTLARWARKVPTAVLQPLPLRLWPGTALPAELMRVRSSRPAPPNHLLDAYDPWLPARLAARAELPVPVLEIGDWSLAPWAELMASRGGSATLRVIDAAAPPRPVASPSPPAPGESVRLDAQERLLAFKGMVSDEAYELAGHLAQVDPLTLPVMRVIQAAALPGTSPSCLSEVLLSGMMLVEQPLERFDVFSFDPGIRSLLRMVVPGTDARRTVDTVSDFITPRLGRSRDFPALIADRTGTLELPGSRDPFAELDAPGPERLSAESGEPASADDVGQGSGQGSAADTPAHPSLEYVVRVRATASPTAEKYLFNGYLVGDRLVLTAIGPWVPRYASLVQLHPDLERPGASGLWHRTVPVWEGQGVQLLRVDATTWPVAGPVPRVRWGRPHELAVNILSVRAPDGDEGGEPEYRKGSVGMLTVRRSRGGAYVNEYVVEPLPPLPPGAALFDGPLLVGVVRPRSPRGSKARQNVAVSPADRFTQEFGFAVEVGPTAVEQASAAVDGSRTIRVVAPPPRRDNLPQQMSRTGTQETGARERLGSLLTSASTARVFHSWSPQHERELLLDYLHLHRVRYSAVWWVEASTIPEMRRAIAGFAAPAGAAERLDDALAWFAAHEGWLVAFVGAGSPADAEEVARTLGPGGTVVITACADAYVGNPSGTLDGGSSEATTGPPEDIDGLADFLGDVVVWLDPPIPLSLFAPLASDDALRRALLRLREESLLEFEDSGTLLSHRGAVPVLPAVESRRPDNVGPRGPGLVAELLMTAFQDGLVYHDVADAMRQVAHLARVVPPGQDTVSMVRLFGTVGTYLIRHSQGRLGVELAERACEVDRQESWDDGDRRGEGFFRRARLFEEALASGLEAFAGLSTVSVHAWQGVTASDDRLEFVRLHQLLRDAYNAVRHKDPRGFPGFLQALALSDDLLGSEHPLTRDIAVAVGNGGGPPGQ